jgi:hypothetical protein
MKTKLFYILVLLGILTIGCSRKVAPTISIPTEQNPCDSTIKALIDSISDVNLVYVTETIYKDGDPIIDTICITDSSNCNYYKITALEIAAKYNSAIKERDFYKALTQSQAKKITNNYNINSNNKKSQIGDGNISQEKNKGPAVNGNQNVIPVKPKQSAIGDGNKLDNSKKGVGWFWLILVGYLGCHVIHKIAIPALMGTNPFTAGISRIKRVFSVFRT